MRRNRRKYVLGRIQDLMFRSHAEPHPGEFSGGNGLYDGPETVMASIAALSPNPNTPKRQSQIIANYNQIVKGQPVTPTARG